MLDKSYRVRCQFNAMHNLDLSRPEKMHAHTFRVTAYLEHVGEELEKIDVCENVIKTYFSRYKGFRLNDIEAFRELLPTIENMCRVFYEDLKKELLPEGVSLIKLELGDSPLAVYSIGSKLLVGSVYNQITEEQFQAYKKRRLKNDEEINEEIKDEVKHEIRDEQKNKKKQEKKESVRDRGNTTSCATLLYYWYLS